MPRWSEGFLYRWFYPIPDEMRLGFLAALSAARDATSSSSLLEAQLKQFGKFLSLPRQQINLLVEASYLRDIAVLRNPDAKESSSARPASRYEPSASVTESVLGYREAGNIIRYLSERWDGRGPHGLVGREIPSESRILRLMEFFVGELHICGDAREALEAVKAEEGAFDPDLVSALERMIDENAAS